MFRRYLVHPYFEGTKNLYVSMGSWGPRVYNTYYPKMDLYQLLYNGKLVVWSPVVWDFRGTPKQQSLS